MAWSLADMAESLEAEAALKTLSDHEDADDLFQDLLEVATRDKEAARKATVARIRARRWAQTDGV